MNINLVPFIKLLAQISPRKRFHLYGYMLGLKNDSSPFTAEEMDFFFDPQFNFQDNNDNKNENDNDNESDIVISDQSVLSNLELDYLEKFRALSPNAKERITTLLTLEYKQHAR